MDINERYSDYVAKKYADKLAKEQNRTGQQVTYQINKMARKALEYVNFV